MFRIVGRLIPFLACALIVGCGPSLQEVTGTVTSGGKPLPDVNVVLQDDKGDTAMGTTDASGAFKFTAVPGKYKASLTVPAGKMAIDSADPYAIPKLPFPQKYAAVATSGLEYEVKSGTNQFDIKAD